MARVNSISTIGENRRRTRSELVPNHAEEAVASLLVLLCLDALGLGTVDDTHHTAALGAGRDDDLDGVGRGAEDVADLRDRLDGVENVDREGVLHEDPEGVPTAGREGVLLRELDALLVVALGAHQARPRRLAERNAKLDGGAAGHARLVEVVGGLDEVGLPEDEVQLVRVLDLDEGGLKRGHFSAKKRSKSSKDDTKSVSQKHAISKVWFCKQSPNRVFVSTIFFFLALLAPKHFFFSCLVVVKRVKCGGYE